MVSDVTGVSLVVLAAGMGRRFGALKQVAPVGPGGEALLDHTMGDAHVPGVDGAVLVVRPEIRDEVVAHVEQRWIGPLDVVEQPGPDEGRTKPWGAAEAVALALEGRRGSVVVANADDYYGLDALESLVDWLRAAPTGSGALVTWPLAATTSTQGAVSRAVCDVGPDGRLRGMVEHHEVVASGGGFTSEHGPVAADAPVSMNLWGLPAAIGPALAAEVALFRATHVGDPEAELPLPTALDALVARGALDITVLPVGTTWVGVTHPDDLEPARQAMSSLVSPIPVRTP